MPPCLQASWALKNLLRFFRCPFHPHRPCSSPYIHLEPSLASTQALCSHICYHRASPTLSHLPTSSPSDTAFPCIPSCPLGQILPAQSNAIPLGLLHVVLRETRPVSNGPVFLMSPYIPGLSTRSSPPSRAPLFPRFPLPLPAWVDGARSIYSVSSSSLSICAYHRRCRERLYRTPSLHLLSFTYPFPRERAVTVSTHDPATSPIRQGWSTLDYFHPVPIHLPAFPFT
jgi:hypothetical protein